MRDWLRRNRSWLLPFGILTIVALLSDLANAPSRNLLSVYVEATLHRQPTLSASLASVRLLLGGVAAFTGGALVQRFGRKQVVIIGLIGIPLAGGIMIFNSLFALVLLSAISGWLIGAYYYGTDIYMITVVPLSSMGIATALLNGFMTLGGAIGNSISGPLVDSLGFSGLGWATIIVGAILVVGAALLLPTYHGDNTRAEATSTGGYIKQLRRKPVQLLSLLRFLPTTYYGMILLLMPLLIYRVSKVPSTAAYYGTVMLLAASACQLLTGRICDRYGRGIVAICCTVIMALTSLVTTLFLNNLAGLFICGTVGVAVAWGLAVTVPGFVCDISTLDERPHTLSVVYVSWYAGMIVGSQAAGWLVKLGDAVPFLVMAVVNLLALVTAIATIRWIRKYGVEKLSTPQNNEEITCEIE